MSPKHKNPKRRAKAAVKAAAGDMCWLCDRGGIEIAHVIAKKKSKLFDMYFYMGLLSNMTINSVENLFFLCSGCHTRFDEEPPAWIFLPSDLKGILETEEQFQIDRLSPTKDGKPLERCAPTEDLDREFIRYQIRDDPTQSESLRSTRIKKWAGNPITTIVHASDAIYKHIRLPAMKYGLPEEVAETLQKLLFLYGKPAPEVLKEPPNAEIPQKIETIQGSAVSVAGRKRKRAETIDIEGTCDDNNTPPSKEDAPPEKRKKLAYAPTNRKRIEAQKKEKERARARARAEEKTKEKENEAGPDIRDFFSDYYEKEKIERKKK